MRGLIATWAFCLMSCSLAFSEGSDVGSDVGSDADPQARTDARDNQICGDFICQGNSFCNLGAEVPICECILGYEGANCTENIDDCVPNPCANGAPCEDGVNDFSCACLDGWTGDRCDEAACPASSLSFSSLSAGCTSAPLTAGILTISSPNGEICIGTALGVDDGLVDGKNGDETVRFGFSTPVTGVSVGSQTTGNGDGNATVGEVTIEAFANDGSLGSTVAGSFGSLSLDALVGSASVDSITITASTSDWRALSSINYTVPCL